ncbi:hypothetical protein [Aquicoccus sp. SU-CL01552]|uniref:hypothetical protein n=1 Tax=Aquicoccus sp. SU-CL01552 TaxID=3127656 RepID=UPI0031025080
MDLMTGLTAANQALGLVKQLRDLDRATNEGEFKLKIAELTEALADAKLALTEAKLTLAEKDEKIRRLEDKLLEATTGDRCPVCRKGKMQLIKKSAPRSRLLATKGVQEWLMACDNPECGHNEKRFHDPNGILNK